MDYKELSAKIKARHPGSYDDMDDRTLAQKMVQKLPQYSDVTFDQPQQGFFGKAWNALKVPEQLSKQGLNQMVGGGVDLQNMIAQKTKLPIGTEITGNRVADVVRNTPKILGETVANLAPGFVSRGALLTAGAAKGLGAVSPVVKALGRGLGSQLEEASGIAPKAEGALAEAYRDPSVLFAKGRKAAGALYKTAKEAAGSTDRLTVGLAKELGEASGKGWVTPKAEHIVSKAMELAEKGDLNPSEAQTARKAVDTIYSSKQYTKEVVTKLRDFFDDLVKSDKGMSEADKTFARGIKADAIRNLLPQNKYGGTSAFKTAMLFLRPGNPLTKLGDLTLLSPLAQGASAAGAGVAARQVINPLVDSAPLATGLSVLLQRRKELQKPPDE